MINVAQLGETLTVTGLMDGDRTGGFTIIQASWKDYKKHLANYFHTMVSTSSMPDWPNSRQKRVCNATGSLHKHTHTSRNNLRHDAPTMHHV